MLGTKEAADLHEVDAQDIKFESELKIPRVRQPNDRDVIQKDNSSI